MEFALARHLERGVRLSEEYVNWSANVANGDARDGTTFSEVVNGFNQWGICRENLMPYLAAQSTFSGPSAAFGMQKNLTGFSIVNLTEGCYI